MRDSCSNMVTRVYGLPVKSVMPVSFSTSFENHLVARIIRRYNATRAGAIQMESHL